MGTVIRGGWRYDEGEQSRCRRWEGYKVWWNVDGAVSTNGALGVVDEFRGERKGRRRKRNNDDGTTGERANAWGARDGVLDG